MWEERDHALHRTYKFKDFKAAFSWMTQAAMHAEKMDHHPTWSNTYNTVEVKLTTHDAGNQITDKDRKLAERMDQCYAPFATE